MYNEGLINPNDQNDPVTKLSLYIASFFVEISRKTLDDYFSVLNKATFYNFDFSAIYEETKMSFLRKFVKSKVPKTESSKKEVLNNKKENSN
jgi:hypothetical protein